MTDEQRREVMFDFLVGEYRKLLRERDWVARSVAAISLNKVPSPKATDALLEVLESDRHNGTKMVAWMCLLSRSHLVDRAQFDRWNKATDTLHRTGLFRGQLRVGLLEFLAIQPPDRRSTRIFREIFETTNSLDSEDIPVIMAAAKALRQWGDTSLVEYLIQQMRQLDRAYRAELILKMVGSPVPLARELRDAGSRKMWEETTKAYVAWWRTAKPTFVAQRSGVDEPWRGLSAQLMEAAKMIPTPMPVEEVNIEDPRWRAELELDPLELESFDVVFVVDTTGSMGVILNWMQRDVQKMMNAFRYVSKNPRIGLTFFRDVGDRGYPRSIPLTSDVKALVRELQNQDAAGGGEDEEEDVLSGLRDAVAKNQWKSMKPDYRKILVLVGDAPPKPNTMSQALAFAEDLVARGFRMALVKIAHGGVITPLTGLDELVQAGGGAAVDIDAVNLTFQGSSELKLKGVVLTYGDWAIAPEPPPLTSATRILSEVLVQAINPLYRNRMEPFARVLVSMCHEHMPEKRSEFTKPPENTRVFDPAAYARSMQTGGRN